MDSWEDLHLPVLRGVVELFDEQGHGPVHIRHIAQLTGLPEEDVRRALGALEHEQPPFFTGSERSVAGLIGVNAPTGHARRTVGQWPTPEGLATKIVEAMEQAAEDEQDEERRSFLKRSATWFRTTGNGVLTGVTATAISRGLGM